MKILHNSSQIRREIQALFTAQGRKVAIVAFVGRDATRFVPNPRSVEVVCWPKAGGTNPDGVRFLELPVCARVFVFNALHMKLYWSENKGCVLTSANLTSNALGDGGLQEVGVLLSAKDVDIHRILRSIPRRKVTGVAMRQT